MDVLFRFVVSLQVDVFVAFLIFTIALLIAGYYVWSVPQQQATDSLAVRLRELRTQSRSGARAPSDLIQREHRGSLAFLGDFVAWLGVMRRLQTYIVQANLKYRAADVVGLSLALAIAFFLLFGLFGMQLLLLRGLLSVLVGALPIAYIDRKSTRLNSSHANISYAVFCLKKKKYQRRQTV